MDKYLVIFKPFYSENSYMDHFLAVSPFHAIAKFTNKHEILVEENKNAFHISVEKCEVKNGETKGFKE